jgi:hypothetical protein
LVLPISGQLDPGAATNATNYELMSAMGLPIGIAQADYNSANDTVTVHLKRRLDLHRSYELTVIGTGLGGLAGASGLLLDGAGSGSPGSDYATSITGGNLVLPKSKRADLRQDQAKAKLSLVDRRRTRAR